MSATSNPQPQQKTRVVPLRTWWAMLLRSFAVQGSWNYETLLGNGIAFCTLPALQHLPGGKCGAACASAVARQATYFNAHPYLAPVAIGALARAELDGEDPVRIERFRTALCGPLGSVGDQLVWAGWLPFNSIVALGAYGLGAHALATTGIFLLLFNAGHLGLRAWGLRAGLARGVRVAPALANPVFRRGPLYVARAAALLAGVALPLALQRAIGPGSGLAGVVVIAAVVGAVLLARFRGRAEGWRVALGVLAAFVLYAVIS